MTFIRGALVVLLGLTCLIQTVEGIASIADPSGMMSGLNLAMSPGVEVPLTFLGLAMIARGALTCIALWWTIQRKPEGLFLARFTALTILLSAPVVYLRLHSVDFAIGDLVQGLLLLVPALLVKGERRQRRRGNGLTFKSKRGDGVEALAALGGRFENAWVVLQCY